MTDTDRPKPPIGAWIFASTLTPYARYKGIVVEYADDGSHVTLDDAQKLGPQRREPSEGDPENWIDLGDGITIAYHHNTASIIQRVGRAKRTRLPDTGPPPEGTCDHCGCRVIDWGDGWEYAESDDTMPEYDGGRDCPDDSPGGEIYHVVDGKDRAQDVKGRP